MPTRAEIFKKFDTQRRHARRRGKEFHFTFDEWVAWWEKHLGPKWYRKRGRRPAQYCMARKKDKGPYSPDNCVCITNRSNRSEQTANGLSRNHGGMKGTKHYNVRLDEKKVRKIFKSKGTSAEIGSKYGVSAACIRDIKLRRSWKHLEL